MSYPLFHSSLSSHTHSLSRAAHRAGGGQRTRWHGRGRAAGSRRRRRHARPPPRVPPSAPTARRPSPPTARPRPCHLAPPPTSYGPALRAARERECVKIEKSEREGITCGSYYFLKNKMLPGLPRIRHVEQNRSGLSRGGQFVRY